MKCWILSMALAVLLLGVGAVSITCWEPGYLFVATATVSPEFAAKWMMNWREIVVKSPPEQQERDLDRYASGFLVDTSWNGLADFDTLIDTLPQTAGITALLDEFKVR